MSTHSHRIDVYLGDAPAEVSERRLLARLKEDLTAQGLDSIILANFYAGPKALQIDIVVATSHAACVVEVKGYLLSVRGQLNGPWMQKLADGTERNLGQRNPFMQASEARFAVINALSADRGLKLEEIRRAVTGLVCLYPSAPSGSGVPAGNYKAWIGGYPKLLDLLGEPARQPVPLEAWRRLAKCLNLVEQNAAKISREAVALDSYRALFCDLETRRRGPYVVPEICNDNGSYTEAALTQLLADGHQFQIVGPSGCGKTVLIDRLAKACCEAHMLPVVVEAYAFEGDLGRLLRRAIANSTRATVQSLVQAAHMTGTSIIVFLDAFNECPAAQRDNLVASLQAARLNYDAQIVLIGQQRVDLSPSLAGEIFYLPQPDPDRRQRIVEAHVGRSLTAEEEPSLEVVATANDAAVLAEVIRDPTASDGRHALYSAFARRRIGDHTESMAVYQALSGLSDHMRRRFATHLPTRAGLRALWQSGHSQSHRDTLHRLAIGSGLVVDDGTYLGFRHELIADFFAAEHLLSEHRDAARLGSALARPINAELSEFAIGGCATVADIDAALRHSPSTSLLLGCLRGACGSKAKGWVFARCRELVERLKLQFTHVTFSLPGDFKLPGLFKGFDVTFSGPESHEADDLKFVPLLSVAAVQGLLPAILSMFRAIDAHLEQEAARLRLLHSDIRIRWKAQVAETIYGFPYRSNHHEFHDLFQSTRIMELTRERRGVEGFGQIVAATQDASPLSPGEMFFLFEALTGFDDYDSTPPTNLIALMKRAHEQRIYHLSLLALDLAHRFGRRLDEQQRRAMGDMIGDWLSNSSPMLNGTIFDVLNVLDCWQHNVTVDEAVEEFRKALVMPDSAEARDLSLTLYVWIFDHPDGPVYGEAFYDVLSQAERRQIYVRAIGVEERQSMFLSYVASELFNDPALEAIPSLQRYAVCPEEDTISVQESVGLFANAVGALARLGADLPAAKGDASAPEEAWAKAASLIYAFNRAGGLCDQDAHGWQTLEGLGAAIALDPIYQLEHEAGQHLVQATIAFRSHFTEGVLRLSRAALERDYAPVSLFARVRSPGDLAKAHRRFALQMIGREGRHSDLARVQIWLDDPALGEAALSAAREIERGSASAPSSTKKLA